jgi:cytochrome c-type biogenesis protein CcmF
MVFCVLTPLLVFLQAKQPQLLSVYGGLMLGLWVSLSTLLALIKKIQRSGFFRVPLAYWGMVVAHVGVAVTVIGIAVSSGFGVQEDVKLIPGETVMLANTTVTFVSESALNGPNYHGTQARFSLKRGKVERVIFPQKRVYDVGHVAMTDAAIDVSFARDIYVALGEPLDDSAWSVRLYYKPLVRWIWAGGVLMMLGGIFAIIDGVYRMHQVARKQGALS